jgi:hypothetical protein
MIISLWNLLLYHSIVRWAIQAQWAEPLVLLVLDSVKPQIKSRFRSPLMSFLRINSSKDKIPIHYRGLAIYVFLFKFTWISSLCISLLCILWYLYYILTPTITGFFYNGVMFVILGHDSYTLPFLFFLINYNEWY